MCGFAQNPGKRPCISSTSSAVIKHWPRQLVEQLTLGLQVQKAKVHGGRVKTGGRSRKLKSSHFEPQAQSKENEMGINFNTPKLNPGDINPLARPHL